MCDGMACQRCICSICRSAGLLWQPAHPCSLFFFFPSPPPHLNYTYINRLLIWMQNWELHVSLRMSPVPSPFSRQPEGFRTSFLVKAASLTAPMLGPCSPAEEANRR